MASPIRNYLSLIKFSHTIFALPFALVGFTLGTLQTEQFSLRVLLLVLGCMVFARSAAMPFNRYLDRDIDAQNPRTRVREIPAGIIRPRSALAFVVLNSTLFVLCAWFINSLCFYLSPVALLVILGYSYTKRFTPLCHLVLGLGLALAPVGAYVAVTGAFSALSVLYGAVVLCWVAGFDIIYALQDDTFDQKLGLRSIPVALGRKGALRLAQILHLSAALFLVAAAYWQQADYGVFHWGHWIGLLCFLALLIYQHTLVRSDDLSRINLAFFTTNGMASILFGLLFILDALLG